MQKTQEQMFYEAQQKIAEAEQQFLMTAGLMPYPDGSMEQEPITKRELRKLISRRPHVYGKYEGYLDQLSDGPDVGASAPDLAKAEAEPAPQRPLTDESPAPGL